MIWLLAIPTYLLLALVAYHIERRVVDAEYPALCAMVWPMRLTMLGVIVGIGAPIAALFGAGWLVDKGAKAVFGLTDNAVDGMASAVRRRLAGKPKPPAEPRRLEPPRISIPRGAVLGSEEYRRLKPLIERYEDTMPVMERE